MRLFDDTSGLLSAKDDFASVFVDSSIAHLKTGNTNKILAKAVVTDWSNKMMLSR